MAFYRSGFQSEPRTPTLDEICSIFKIANGFRFGTSEGSDMIEIAFTVSRKDCEAAGIHVNLFASVFLRELNEHLSRLRYFDGLTKQYHEGAGADTAACMAFVQAERKATSSRMGPESAIRNKMWTAVMHKLVELQAWRMFVDQEKMERERKAEEAKKREEERKARESERARQRGEDEPHKDYDWYRRKFYEEAQHNQWEDIFRQTDFGGFKRGEDTFRWGNEKQEQRSRVKPEGRWWEVLGVEPGATKAVIKTAWRKLASKYHPDRYKEPDANERMAEINAAKDVGLAAAAD